MIKDVIIEIKTEQTVDSDTDCIEFTTDARYGFKDGSYFVSYDESQLLEVDGEVAQTLTYSINSYVYTKCENADAELTAMQSLALALYRYGASALAYKA